MLPVAIAQAEPLEDDNAVFKAALCGDLRALHAHMYLRNARTPEGYEPLGLAVSAGQVESTKLLLRAGVNVDAADEAGVTALMHAAMHGHVELIKLLMMHGASPSLCRADGKSVVGLAAEYGRPAALGTFFRADPSLVEFRDGLGRTPVMSAVSSRHTPTLKYMLGCWRPNVGATDAAGNTLLHLCRGPVEILLLIYHGSATRPDIDATNELGLTPQQSLEEAGETELAMLLAEVRDQPADGRQARGLLNDTEYIDRRLFSFLVLSPLRAMPQTTPLPCCVRRLGASQLLFVPLPFVFETAAALGAGVGSATTITAWSVLLWALIHIWSHRHTRRPSKSAVQMPAVLLFEALLLLTLSHAFLAPRTHETSPLFTPLTTLMFLAYWCVYARLISLQPGLVVGDRAVAHRKYWDAFEQLQAGQSCPADFCERSELQRPSRSHFSPMTNGLVRVMDHDCPWIGGCVGAGNNRSFVLMTLVGLTALVCYSVVCYSAAPPAGFASWVEAAASGGGVEAAVAQLVVSSAVVSSLLYLLLVPITCSQLWMVSVNVTTLEVMRWQQQGSSTPWFRSHHRWRQFSPYDRGTWKNAVAFVTCDREPVDETEEDDHASVDVESGAEMQSLVKS